MGSRDKIIAAAIALFNRADMKSVTTNHIAEAAGVSPGNLYYHFKSKEQIVRAIFKRMVVDEERACVNCCVDDIDSLSAYYGRLLGVFWRYRFFKREMVFLLKRDAGLKKEFDLYQERLNAEIETALRGFIAAGIMRPLPDRRFAFLVQNVALILNFWLPFCEMSSPRITKASLKQGLDLIVDLLEVYKA